MTLHEAGLEAALLPCPFCGRQPTTHDYREHSDETGETYGYASVECDHGGKNDEHGTEALVLFHAGTLEYAIDCWNRRASLPAPQGPAAIKAEWPKEHVCIPDPHHPEARIIGFRIRPGDPAWGEMGLSEPLFWLERMIAAPQPQSPDTGAQGAEPVQPVAWPPLVQLGRTLAFFTSAIKSGEAWSDTCQRDYDLANQAMKDLYTSLSHLDATRADRDGGADILRSLLRAEYESAGYGLHDCIDNDGQAYQSGYLDKQIKRAEAYLAALKHQGAET